MYEMTTIFLWLLFGGVCLLVFGVFLSLSVMVVKSGWEAPVREAQGEKPGGECEPLRKERR